MAAAEIPEKQYFKIGEVAKIAGVEPYVLRYWETEFRTIRPDKTRSNQRLYRRRDVETVLKIKELLYAQGYRIEGARRRLRELEGETLPASAQKLIAQVRRELLELEKILDNDER